MIGGQVDDITSAFSISVDGKMVVRNSVIMPIPKPTITEINKFLRKNNLNASLLIMT
jgi:hypothetical protein